ncbi:3120_t:CDS:1, partial [Gigaspora rosea]
FKIKQIYSKKEEFNTFLDEFLKEDDFLLLLRLQQLMFFDDNDQAIITEEAYRRSITNQQKITL